MGKPEPKPEPRRRPLDAAPEAAVRRRAPSEGITPAEVAPRSGLRVESTPAVEPQSVMLENLLEEGEWLRRVARSITSDPHLADDIVQNTYLAAMRSPPRDPAKRRAWLRTVVKNYARLSYREGSRRTTREKATARSEAVPSGEHGVEQDELHGMVAETVAALREPYRSTVIEHYYRGRSSQEIAEELGIPANTVRVRLRRAVKQLSESLDGVCDGKRAVWALPLIGLFVASSRIEAMAAERGVDLSADLDAFDEGASSAGPAGALGLGAVLSSEFARTLIPIVAIAGLLWWILPGSPEPGVDLRTARLERESARSIPVTHTSEIGRPRLDSVPVRSTSPATGRDPLGVDPSPPAAKPAFATTPNAVRVIDRATGAPIFGSSVFTEPSAMRSERMARGRTRLEYLMLPFARTFIGRTDREGRLEADPARLAIDRILVRAPGYAEFRERERLRLADDRTIDIALDRAPEGTIAVRFADGSPARRVPVTVTAASGAAFETTTDDQGALQIRFEEPQYAIEIDLDGFATVRALALPDGEITLDSAPEHLLTITDPAGRALPDVSVELRLPDRTVLHRTTDGRGMVAFHAAAAGAVTVIAEHDEFPVARIDVPLGTSDPTDVADPHASGVRTVIPFAEPCWVEGAITVSANDAVLADGAALGGSVLLLDDLPFMVRDLPAAKIRGASETGPTASTGARPARSERVVGHFRIGPLPANTPLRLLVEPEGLAARELTVDPVAPYSTAAVTVETSPGWTLAGRCVTPDGVPVPGVRMRLGAIVGDELRGPLVVSGDDGRFRVPGLSDDLPLIRATLAEPRWTALGDLKKLPGKGLPARGRLLQVLAPHQLLAVDGTELPRNFFLGSRNTVSVPERSREEWQLVVDPWPAERVPAVALRDGDGAPVRDVFNWIIHPVEDPSDISRMFAGTDGMPVRIGDPTPLEGCWVTFYGERHAVAGGVFGLQDQIENLGSPRRNSAAEDLFAGVPEAEWVVTLSPRVERTIVLRYDDGTPASDLDLWWVPDDPRAFLAIALGRSDLGGSLTVDRLPPGRFALVATRASEAAPGTTPRPFIDAIAHDGGPEVGLLTVPRSGGARLEVRIDRLPPSDSTRAGGTGDARDGRE